jgi:hypothetical protein
MSRDILTEWPSASFFEHRLATMGLVVIEGSETDTMLKRYSAARAELAHERIAASIKSTGYALAALKDVAA